jgi:hypothetical protein
MFRTWCGHLSTWDANENADEPQCNDWGARGSYMDSGNLTDISRVYSVLVVHFVITNPAGGYLKFRYASDSNTHSDGLYVWSTGILPHDAAGDDVDLTISLSLCVCVCVQYQRFKRTTALLCIWPTRLTTRMLRFTFRLVCTLFHGSTTRRLATVSTRVLPNLMYGLPTR